MQTEQALRTQLATMERTFGYLAWSELTYKYVAKNNKAINKPDDKVGHYSTHLDKPVVV